LLQALLFRLNNLSLLLVGDHFAAQVVDVSFFFRREDLPLFDWKRNLFEFCAF
jgi:hypothetical protein